MQAQAVPALLLSSRSKAGTLLLSRKSFEKVCRSGGPGRDFCGLASRQDEASGAVRFVDEHEVLIHPFGIGRSLEHEQVFRSDQTMLHSGLEMKPVARHDRLNRERLGGGSPRQDEPRAFPHLQVFILLFVHLKSEVSTLTDREILFDPRLLMQNDDHTSPRRLDGPFITPIDPIEKFSKKCGLSNGRMTEVLTPEQARFAAITIKRVPGVDARLGAQTSRDGGRLGVAGQPIMI